MVYTSYFLTFSKPKPGGRVYLWGPYGDEHDVEDGNGDDEDYDDRLNVSL